MILSDVNLVKNLASSLNDYDALVVVATQLDEITGFVDGSVSKDLQTFAQVKIKIKTKFFSKILF